MRKTILLLLVSLLFASCEKKYIEDLFICMANAYDQTVMVKGLHQDYTVKPGGILNIAFCCASGHGNHIDTQALWNQFFYEPFTSVAVCSEDGTVLKSWSKENPDPGNPFLFSSWTSENKIEKGVEGGPGKGLAYTFLISAYSRTDYNLTFILNPTQE